MLRRRGASLDTEGAAATDNPATIKGGTDGQVMVFTTTSDARDVTINYNTGNIFLKGGVAGSTARFPHQRSCSLGKSLRTQDVIPVVLKVFSVDFIHNLDRSAIVVLHVF